MRHVFLQTMFVLSTMFALVGCNKAAVSHHDTPAAPFHAEDSTKAATVASSEWSPTTKGLPYQLGLQGGIFHFCDEAGPHFFHLATGTQSTGTQRCDQNTKQVQSSCDDSVQIHGDPDAPYDDISINNNDYLLRGHVAACDRQEQFLIVATYGGVEVIDGVANKVAVVERNGGDQAVIGSGWVAWRALDDKRPLRLETLAKALEHATTAK